MNNLFNSTSFNVNFFHYSYKTFIFIIQDYTNFSKKQQILEFNLFFLIKKCFAEIHQFYYRRISRGHKIINNKNYLHLLG